MKISRPAAVAASLTLLGAIPAAAQVAFTDRTDLLVNHALYSGVAMGVADMNGDGRDDIIRLAEATDLEIEYQQAPYATFTRYVYGDANPGSSITEWSLCIADVDENGFNDILVGGFGAVTRLLEADATGTAYARTNLPSSTLALQASNFADIDNDGILDAFLCNDTGPNFVFEGQSGGAFVRNDALCPTPAVTTAMTGDEDGSGNYGSIWADYDNDGDIDLYISKCSHAAATSADARRLNTLWRNNGAGVFTEAGLAAGMRDGAQSWVTAFGDIDNDGDLDAFIVNHSPSSRLMENNGDGTFADITTAAGFLAADLNVLGIQADFTDFDNDGFVDLLLSARNFPATADGVFHRLFRNNGNSTFTLLADPFATVNPAVPDAPGTGPHRIHSFALGDLNADGFVDVSASYGSGYNSPSVFKVNRIWMNDGNANHHIAVRGIGTTSNRSAVGARVEIHGDWGIQVREVRSGEGYGVMHSLTQYFGLGSATSVQRIVVRWPAGAIDEVFFPAIDQAQALLVTEGSSPNPLTTWLAAHPGVTALDADDDDDTMDTVLEFALQRDPLSEAGDDGQLSLPAVDTADTGGGERLRIHFNLPEPALANVIYRVEANGAALDPASWTTIASKTGAAAWSGPAAVILGTPASGRIDVTVEDTQLVGPGGLRCLRLTAVLVALPES